MSPRSRKSKAARKATSQSRITVDRADNGNGNFIDKIQTDLEKNQSYLNLILGALIVIVLGVLIFNYFNKPNDDQTGQVTETAQTIDEQGDVTKESLPGAYTVKEGDTLFLIAQKYYDDGNMYTEIVRENNLPNDAISAGQKLTIPKLSLASASASPEGSPAASETPIAQASPSLEASPTLRAIASVEPSPSPSQIAQGADTPAASGWGTGGATNQTTWGETIKGDTYTVVAGDWLSKIAGRAYGDIMQYEKIAKANNLANPDSIEIGTVLKIPRD